MDKIKDYFAFANYLHGWYEYNDNTEKGDVYSNVVTGKLFTEEQIFDEWTKTKQNQQAY